MNIEEKNNKIKICAETTKKTCLGLSCTSTLIGYNICEHITIKIIQDFQYSTVRN